jgi:hypothetical protein
MLRPGAMAGLDEEGESMKRPTPHGQEIINAIRGTDLSYAQIATWLGRVPRKSRILPALAVFRNDARKMMKTRN